MMNTRTLMMSSLCIFLASCGGGKSNLTGVWQSEFKNSITGKTATVYTTFSAADKDGNIFSCRNTEDMRLVIPVQECTNTNGKLFKVVDSKNACISSPLGQYCVTYLPDVHSIKFPDGIQDWKRRKD